MISRVMERVMAPSKTESRRLGRRKPVTGQVISLALAAFAAIAMFSLARAHGPAEWINIGGYKNGAGELCCGERDCFELADGDVTITAVGYFVHSLEESVPFSEAQPSPDGRYW